MGFKIPNYTEAVATGVGDQAEPDSVDFQILGNPANGVVFDPTRYPNNAEVTPTSTESNTVNIAPYKVILDDVYYHNNSGTITVALESGDANPRFDLVVIPKATPAVPTYRKGTASSTNPQFPSIVDGDIVLAALYRAGSGAAGYVSDASIIDKRLFIPSNTTWISGAEPTLVANSSGAVANDGDIWVTTASAATGKSNVWVKSAGTWENLAEYVAMSSANNALNIVQRDASGNFAANTITANLIGNVTGNVTGSSGSTTGNAATATNATNANTVAGLAVHAGRNNEGNKVVRTDGNGYLQVGYINSSNGNEGNNSNPGRVWGTNGSDDYLRSYLTSALSVGSAGYASSAGTAAGLAANSNAIAETGGIWSIYGGVDTPRLFTGDASISYINNYGGVTGAGTPLIRVGVNGAVRVQGSLRELKNNIEDFNDGLEIIKKLKPKTFKWNDQPDDPEFEKSLHRDYTEHGFIVEEVVEVLPDLVYYSPDKNGQRTPNMWKANDVIALLVQAVQELSAKVEALEKKKK